MDSIGNVYVADRNNHAIRKITQSGGVSCFYCDAVCLGFFFFTRVSVVCLEKRLLVLLCFSFWF